MEIYIKKKFGTERERFQQRVSIRISYEKKIRNYTRILALKIH